MKTERDLFEIYAVRMCYSVERYDPAVDAGLGGYVSPITIAAWLAWQAATTHNTQLQAAIDKLPHTKDGVLIVPGMEVFWVDECSDKLLNREIVTMLGDMTCKQMLNRLTVFLREFSALKDIAKTLPEFEIPLTVYRSLI